MESQQFEAACTTPVAEWNVSSPEVTLRLTATDARRIVRALEETSVRLGGSPSGARMASSYIRLAGIVRRQSSVSR
jgi:hypothetical protein